MQARNLNVGVSLEKLGPPSQRHSLAGQTAFLAANLAYEMLSLVAVRRRSADGVALTS